MRAMEQTFDPRRLTGLVALLALCGAVLAVILLERARAGLNVTQLTVQGTPVTLLRPQGDAPLPLVVVAHGYGGSRQMMRAISTTLARGGVAVANIDLLGHGRHRTPMGGDVTRLDGATARLVDQVVATTMALRERPGIAGPVSLVGHSMATDVVVRASQRLPDVAAVVAISMYSEAVTPTDPARLLILSGAQEARLRGVALEAVRLVAPGAVEGQTVDAESVARRAAVAPLVGHVGVLYAEATLTETQDWIAAALDRPMTAAPSRAGIWTGLLLVSVLALAWPLARAFGPPSAPSPVPRRVVWVALGAPILPALAGATLMPDGVLGVAAFGQLAVFFGLWGSVQGAVLWRAGHRPKAPDLWPATALLGWSLCIFAMALDRYGGAFLPVGPRLSVMALLLPATMVFALADAVLTRGAGWVTRIAARVLPLATLLGVMVVSPMLGVAFTVIPVVLLYWLVFGLAARWMGARSTSGTTGLALGLLLAWSIAATTPMIAV
ncbi:MAG: alpha/beta fold hydrolase [Pseudomonadota bacterium]